MRQRNTATRVTIAACSALALVASASPAIAGSDTTLVHDVPVEGVDRGDYDYWTSDYWSVVAVRPTKKADLTLYDNEQRTNTLVKSEEKKKKIDVVAADANEARYGTYYPTVKGKGTYQVEVSASFERLTFDNPLAHVMQSSDVLWAMETYVFPTRDNPVTITATTDGDNDIELLVFQSSPQSSSTWYQGRAQAICDKDSGGVGERERCVIRNDTDSVDYFEVVVLNKAGTGTVSLKRTSGY